MWPPQPCPQGRGGKHTITHVPSSLVLCTNQPNTPRVITVAARGGQQSTKHTKSDHSCSEGGTTDHIRRAQTVTKHTCIDHGLLDGSFEQDNSTCGFLTARYVRRWQDARQPTEDVLRCAHHRPPQVLSSSPAPKTHLRHMHPQTTMHTGTT